MELKAGVKIQGLQPEVLMGVLILSKVFEEFNIPFVITACTDGKHMKGSKHYVGQAVDARSKNVPKDKKHVILAEAKRRLGKNFDLILEAEGKLNEHYHLEFDPK